MNKSSLWVTLLTLIFCVQICFADELIIEPDAGRAPLLDLIQKAHSSIKLVMYGLKDHEMMDAIIAAKNQGKKVQVILEAHPYKFVTENDAAMNALNANQIDLQATHPKFKLVHQKTLLIDQVDALVMTFNWTAATFKNERNFALIITDPAEVGEIQTVFSADWQQKNSTSQQSHLIWSPDNSREKIMDYINHAHTSLNLYMQSITDYQTIGALAKAARSGIQVHILLPSMNKKKTTRTMNYLTKAGVTLRYSKHYYIHAKVILADQKSAILGSINLTKPSMDSNRELSVLTTDSKVVHQLSQTFNQDWDEAQ